MTEHLLFAIIDTAKMKTGNPDSTKTQSLPLFVTREFLSGIDIEDPFFHSFIRQYINFKNWFEYLKEAKRQAWIFKENNTLKAFLLTEEEATHIPGATTEMEPKKRLDISKIKISLHIPVILDLFLKLAIKEALEKNIDEIYYTCFADTGLGIIPGLLNFGFIKTAKKTNNEDIFIKKLRPPPIAGRTAEINRLYYPTFYDGIRVRKYILPVSATLHRRLFADTRCGQPNLFEKAGELFIEGNTIKKALLCKDRRIAELLPGDILLIYCMQDIKAITNLCIVEQLDSYNTIREDRPLYIEEESIHNSQSLILLMRWYFHLPVYIDSSFISQQNIHTGNLNRLTRIDHRKYKMIMNQSRLDSNFRVT